MGRKAKKVKVAAGKAAPSDKTQPQEFRTVITGEVHIVGDENPEPVMDIRLRQRNIDSKELRFMQNGMLEMMQALNAAAADKDGMFYTDPPKSG